MALGRSGTESTWQIIGRLTGKETPSVEYTGSNTKESVSFFKNQIGTKWLTEYMCILQNTYSDASVVGFKWKPHSESFYSPASQAGLELMSILVKPQIKVVRSRRNPLNVYISRRKHSSTDKPSAHCDKNNTKCLNKHLQTGKGIKIDLEDMYQTMNKITENENGIDANLKKLKVPHILVSYEKLYKTDDAEEWMRIFRFLGKGPTKDLTKEMVNDSMKYVATTNPQNVSISNYDEVVNFLKGTKFEKLIE
eukprot:CAMPEP_0184856490 /NCGR_PEP_ID=MMETSP0580-20130426/1675_1 /TAXON_ID=1118495 /ORGANISM="Dactyliosolen fragilissimus" /LENGTH=250 /DNA_ID=CAMNT_0027351561 /DNA_START=302 /DNA_END=1054 /DNA_ORIENTATION=+